MQVKKRQTVVGAVCSDARDKTITVKVSRFYKHPLLKKYMQSSTKYHAHDENNVAKVGQKVRIEESRPLSKTKRWVLKQVLEEGVEV